MRKKDIVMIKRSAFLLAITTLLSLSIVAQQRTTGTMGSGLRTEASSTQINYINRGGNLISFGTRTDGSATTQTTTERGSPAIGTGLRQEITSTPQTSDEGNFLNIVWIWVAGII